MHEDKRTLAIAILILAALSGAATSLKWADIRSSQRHGTGGYGQSSDGTGATNAIPKYDASGSLIGSGVTIDSSDNVSTSGAYTSGVGSAATGALDLTGKTSGNTVTITVGDSTGSGTLTAPGATGTLNYIATPATSGHCAQFGANGIALTDAGAACGTGGGGVGPGASGHNTGTQSVSNGGGAATLTFNTNDWDTGSIHSTSINPTRFTAPSTGYYLVGCHVKQNSNATGQIYLILQVNGATVTAIAYNSAGNADMMLAGYLVSLNAGDYVEFLLNNFSTGTWSTSSGASGQLTKLSGTL